MKMKNTVVLMIVVVAVATIVAVFSAVSCSEHTDKEHVRDMVLAENPGLKGILELYQEDSLKYEAALFLIDNMGYYQGADSGELNVQSIRNIQHGTLYLPASIGFGREALRKAQECERHRMEGRCGYGSRIFGIQYRVGFQSMEGTAMGEKRFIRTIL